jgi:poly(ADP-ribose) glycohydrolase
MDLTSTIKSYVSCEYGQITFEALRTYLLSLGDKEKDVFFNYILPCIIQFALDLPNSIKTRLGLLRAGTEHFVLLSQGQIACILANAFLCTFAWQRWRDTDSDDTQYPSINFLSLFDRPDPTSTEKLKFIAHYFFVLGARRDSGAAELQQTVLFQRRIGAPQPTPQSPRACTALRARSFSPRASQRAHPPTRLSVPLLLLAKVVYR